MAFFQKAKDQAVEQLTGTLKSGSSGSQVKLLQTLLNQNGANLEVDGVFGSKTEAAVKDYQTKNNLAVDGMVGPETSGSLTGGSSAGSTGNKGNAGSTGSTGSSGGGASAPKEFTYDDYKASDTVAQAQAALQQQLAAKPGDYQSTWQGQINGIIDRIMNREDFSYDVNSDALYQQYKDQYSTLGKLAMQDTMGQAAGLTGGYGSSYASTAGNQAYQSYLSRLNEVVPELYGMARDQYNQEGQELYNQYGLLTDQDSQDYGRYVDQYNQWASERDHLQGVYNDERNFDYGKYSDDKSYAYDEYRNAISDQQWEKNYELNKNADDRSQEAWALEKKAYEEAKASGGSVEGGTNSAALEHVASMSSAEIVETMQAYNYDGDNTGLAAFLDDCVASGRLTEAQADNYYAKYRTGNDNGVTDTTVNANKFHSGALGGGGTMNAIKN